MLFRDLTFTFNQQTRASQALAFFPNGQGASIIRGPYSYGGTKGLYELAVIRGKKPKEWDIDYTTPLTSDVIGNLTPGKVEALLAKIEALPAVED